MATTIKPKSTPSPRSVAKVVKVTSAPTKTVATKVIVAKKSNVKIEAKPVPNFSSTTPKIVATVETIAKVSKPIKTKKIKLVRDSFTIPKPEYLILDNLKLRAADLKNPVKKSELLRAGIKALAAMTDANFLAALKVVPVLKSGRPSK